SFGAPRHAAPGDGVPTPSMGALRTVLPLPVLPSRARRRGVPPRTARPAMVHRRSRHHRPSHQQRPRPPIPEPGRLGPQFLHDRDRRERLLGPLPHVLPARSRDSRDRHPGPTRAHVPGGSRGAPTMVVFGQGLASTRLAVAPRAILGGRVSSGPAALLPTPNERGIGSRPPVSSVFRAKDAKHASTSLGRSRTPP